MEVLKFFWQHTALPASASATETLDSINCFLSTSSFGTTATSVAEPRVFAFFSDTQRSAFTAAGTYMSQMATTGMQDLTDGDGHGILIATDNIFAQVTSTATGNANAVNIKLLYRWKNVSLSEYIGIVQSQT